MVENPEYLIDPKQARIWIAEKRHLWQMHFYDVADFQRFISDKGIKGCNDDQIKKLWQVGLLHADLIISDDGSTFPYFEKIGQIEDEEAIFLYTPPIDYLKDGWVNSAKNLPELPPVMKLYFHPFRYYVVQSIYQILEIVKISPTQTMTDFELATKALEFMLARFKGVSTNPDTTQKILRLNNICDLIIALEPCFYGTIFQSIHYNPMIMTASQQKELMEIHWQNILPLIQQLGSKLLEEVRQDICINAEQLDPNKKLYRLLRLANEDFRLGLKGKLGGSILLHTMAEILRRAMEDVFQKQFREEDELGFGSTPKTMKQKLYGSNRIFDGDRNSARQFLTDLGMDYGVRLRWYVEGDTELGALQYELRNFTAIQLINLKGRVAEKKIAAFEDNLKMDFESQIFSFISIDGDREDYVRAVRKATTANKFCGMIFIAVPDFEFDNFSVKELANILWKIAEENGATSEKKFNLFEAVKDAKSGEELMNVAKGMIPELRGKGRVWGEYLMKYARNNPHREDSNEERPIIKAIDYAVRGASFADFLLTFENMRIDPNTGLPDPR